MWSYYGRKTKVVKYYPVPRYDTIIEPFAGTAVYSLHQDNWKKNVILIEKYDIIVNIWKYLQAASSEDILSLPDILPGQSIDDFSQMSNEEKWLVGFMINEGSANPKRKRSMSGNFASGYERNREKIATNLFKIKHWDIRLGDYSDISNAEATWFIDPPYQHGGQYYRHNKINYESLSWWCKERYGQVIVCENDKAGWMNFNPLKSMQGSLHRTVECMWTNDVAR